MIIIIVSQDTTQSGAEKDLYKKFHALIMVVKLRVFFIVFCLGETSIIWSFFELI